MSETKTRQVTITDVDYEVVKEMIRYIYTAEMPRIFDFDFTTKLLKAADKVGLAIFF